MFFKDIDYWSKSKLRIYTLSFAILYFLLLSIVPCVIIGVNYHVFSGSEPKLKITGGLLIIIILLSTTITSALKTAMNLLPQATQKQQIVRYSLEFVVAAILPIVVLVIVHLIRVNMETALDTIKYCMFSYLGALAVYYTCVKTLLYQWHMNGKVDELEKMERIKSAR